MYSELTSEARAALREAINMPIQGTSADLMKIGMRRVWDRLRDRGMRAKLILQVHDEVVFDLPPEEVVPLYFLVREIFEHIVDLPVPTPVEVGIGPSWGEVSKMEL